VRFDEFVLGVPGEDEGFRIRFHEQLTVLAGIGALERQALLDAVVGALTGSGDGTTITGVDSTGRPMQLVSGGGRVTGRYLDDGSTAPSPVGWFATDGESLRNLVVLTADDLGPTTSAAPRDDDPPELAEARTMLRDLEAQLETITGAQSRLEAALAELAELDGRIAIAEAHAARREYAKVLAELERVRAEASASMDSAHGAEIDQRMLRCEARARELITSWSACTDASALARLAAEGDDEVEDVDVERLMSVPAEVPAELAGLVAALARAGDHAAALEGRLRAVASASLPEPEDPRVLGLATVDQGDLWAAHARVVEAAASLQADQVAMGGLGADGERLAAIEELETAHAGAETASNLIERRTVPVIASSALAAVLALPMSSSSTFLALALLLAAAAGAAFGLGGPWRDRAAAEKREAAALARVGVPTYLGFHLRRVDATLDPTTFDRLGLAEAELEAASRSWAMACGGVSVSVVEAAALEAQVREYAAALAEQQGAVQEVAELRRTLDELALPDLAAAEDRVLQAVSPYGLGATDLEGLEPELVPEFVAGQVALGHAARRRAAQLEAAAAESAAAEALGDLLTGIGFAEGTLDERLGSFEWALERAREREAARAAARSREEVDADLARLEAEEARLRRPEWVGTVSSADASEPDVASLVARRDQLTAEVAAAERPFDRRELEHLTAHHEAAVRRVTAMELKLRGKRGDDGADVDQLQQYLLAALTRACHAGPHKEPVPVLLDDPFLRVPAERKWELMDMLRRLAEKTQLLYLTDDPFVGAWARRRADTGAITLLEPVE
jgi:hypothetical protein